MAYGRESRRQSGIILLWGSRCREDIPEVCSSGSLEIALGTNLSVETSSLVIDTLCDELSGGDMVVACIYCDFNADKEQSATSVLAALLKQIAAGVEPIPEEIQVVFDRAKREVDGRPLRLAEIRAMLTKSALSLLQVFICIDGIDEFPTKRRPELWDSLQRIIRECPNIRLFITGRPHIREEVRKYFPGYPDQPPIKPTEEDIREYLIMRLRNDSELDAMDTRLEADILTIIPDKISGAYVEPVHGESKVMS